MNVYIEARLPLLASTSGIRQNRVHHSYRSPCLGTHTPTSSSKVTSLRLTAQNARPYVVNFGRGFARCAATRRSGAATCASTAGSLGMVAAGANIPHPDKVKTGGEDALMITDSRSGRQSAAVADGVSSWSKRGVDAGAYSSVLVTAAREFLMSLSADNEEDGLGDRVAQNAIERAHEAAKVPGSATFVVASLQQSTAVLDVANVGDAGLRVVRKGAVVLATTQKQHQFEMPYQLACTAFADVKDQFDSAADAECLSFTVQEGDWIVLASDGLYDNMYNEELVQILNGSSEADPFSAAQAIAREVAMRANQHSLDQKWATPYAAALAAEKEEKAQFKTPAWMKRLPTGGKLDDITVIIAKVVALGENTSAVDAAGQAAEQWAEKFKAITEKAVAANAANAAKQQRLRDTIAARERDFQESLKQ